MRRLWAIARATALEMMSEPLSLLVLIGALALAVFSPALHYHQFGEPTRMARDAGLSALLLAGSVFAVFGTHRTVRRELESGTAAVAVAIAVTRTRFLLGKALGAFLAFLVFAVTVAAVSLTVTKGAAIGGEIAAVSGDIPKLWGPSYALGVASVVLPCLVAAALNRFARCRFCLTAFLLTVLVGLASTAYRFDAALLGRLAPVWVAMASVTVVYLVATAALSVRFRTNAALGGVAALALLSLPYVGNHCLSDALSRNGSVGWGHCLALAGATLPAVAAFLLLGAAYVNERDLV